VCPFFLLLHSFCFHKLFRLFSSSMSTFLCRAMAPKNILITGCNRGIGLELVKQMLKRGNEDAPSKLIATCRDTNKAEELMALKEGDNWHHS